MMTNKTDNSTTTTSASDNNNAGFSKYTYETNTNANNNSNQNNQNTNDINESINRSLDQTKDNINRSIDESRNQIPRYNNIVNSYQEQSLQTAKEISEEYIESQKAVINSLQSAWRPYSESYNSLVTSISSPDSMKSTMQQAKDNAKQLSNLNVNAARTFEQNSRQIASAVSEANSGNSQGNS